MNWPHDKYFPIYKSLLYRCCIFSHSQSNGRSGSPTQTFLLKKNICKQTTQPMIFGRIILRSYFAFFGSEQLNGVDLTSQGVSRKRWSLVFEVIHNEMFCSLSRAPVTFGFDDSLMKIKTTNIRVDSNNSCILLLSFRLLVNSLTRAYKSIIKNVWYFFAWKARFLSVRI